jgi:DNA gyrase inhibitor GyrI
MDVQIVVFPETNVAAIEHFGSPALEHNTVRKSIAWKLEQRLLDPAKHRSYGIHYTDPRTSGGTYGSMTILSSVTFSTAARVYNSGKYFPSSHSGNRSR